MDPCSKRWSAALQSAEQTENEHSRDLSTLGQGERRNGLERGRELRSWKYLDLVGMKLLARREGRMVDFYTRSQADFEFILVEDFRQGDLLAMQDFRSPYLFGSLPLQEERLSTSPDRIELCYELPNGARLISNTFVQITADWQKNRRVVAVTQVAHWGDRLLGRLVDDAEQGQTKHQSILTTEHSVPFYTHVPRSLLVRTKDLQPGDVLAFRDEETGLDGFIPIESVTPMDGGALLLEYSLPNGAKLVSGDNLRISAEWEESQWIISVTQVVEPDERFLSGMRASYWRLFEDRFIYNFL
jgi:hypothetical protein